MFCFYVQWIQSLTTLTEHSSGTPTKSPRWQTASHPTRYLPYLNPHCHCLQRLWASTWRSSVSTALSCRWLLNLSSDPGRCRTTCRRARPRLRKCWWSQGRSRRPGNRRARWRWSWTGPAQRETMLKSRWSNAGWIRNLDFCCMARQKWFCCKYFLIAWWKGCRLIDSNVIVNILWLAHQQFSFHPVMTCGILDRKMASEISKTKQLL